MKNNKPVLKQKEVSAAEIVHEALEALRTKLSEALGDQEHNVLETIKYAASKVIHKAEKVLDQKSLKKAAKKAIKAADKALKDEKSAVTEKKPAKKSAQRSTARRTVKAVKKAPAKKAASRSSRSKSSK